ncbi:hypothetical protein FHS76_003728 [Ochrobactrum daejeonense]|uniref:Uncharacterized protein n=1 Tax=Brucella daejeonensis TaxID=659015 RepID=A0A7W9B056_9HYPH|nr:hypothetical protein [Brucella daejeonensis]
MKSKRPETSLPAFENILAAAASPETTMLPTPEETILPAIKSVTPTGSYLVGIQLHFTPGLLKKGGNAQNRIFRPDHEQSNGSLHAHLLPKCRNLHRLQKAFRQNYAWSLPQPILTIGRDGQLQFNLPRFAARMNNALILKASRQLSITYLFDQS